MPADDPYTTCGSGRVVRVGSSAPMWSGCSANASSSTTLSPERPRPPAFVRARNFRRAPDFSSIASSPLARWTFFTRFDRNEDPPMRISRSRNASCAVENSCADQITSC